MFLGAADAGRRPAHVLPPRVLRTPRVASRLAAQAVISLARLRKALVEQGFCVVDMSLNTVHAGDASAKKQQRQGIRLGYVVDIATDNEGYSGGCVEVQGDYG